MPLPTDKQARKERPIASGVLKYFPDAIAEVAYVSWKGNQQHNPGEPMHWARHKSTDHSDCVARHLTEAGTIDDDGVRHTAKAAWRILALLQIELEEATTRDAFIQGSLAMALKQQVSMAEIRDNPSYSQAAVERLDYEYQEACKLRNELAVEVAKHGEFDRPVGTIYISGPMRGHPHNNFPAFDEAADHFRTCGFTVISPADMDRADPGPQSTEVYADRDYAAIRKCTHIAMLPGWEHSTGAVAEFFLARWLGLKVLDANGKFLKTYIKTALEAATMRYLTEGE